MLQFSFNGRHKEFYSNFQKKVKVMGLSVTNMVDTTKPGLQSYLEVNVHLGRMNDCSQSIPWHLEQLGISFMADVRTSLPIW